MMDCESKIQVFVMLIVFGEKAGFSLWCSHANIFPNLIKIDGYKSSVEEGNCTENPGVTELIGGLLCVSRISLGETDLEVFRNKFKRAPPRKWSNICNSRKGKLGEQDGLWGKGDCCQVWQPGFNPMKTWYKERTNSTTLSSDFHVIDAVCTFLN